MGAPLVCKMELELILKTEQQSANFFHNFVKHEGSC